MEHGDLIIIVSLWSHGWEHARHASVCAIPPRSFFDKYLPQGFFTSMRPYCSIQSGGIDDHLLVVLRLERSDLLVKVGLLLQDLRVLKFQRKKTERDGWIL